MPPPAPDDVATLDSLVAALYGSISYEPGGEPDWERFASLFHPDGRLIPPRSDDPELPPVLSVEEFVRLSTEYMEVSGFQERGFYEREIGRTSERFGSIVHLFSVYESLHAPDDAEPFSRGGSTQSSSTGTASAGGS